MTRCWRCGRAVKHGTRYVYGVVCDRGECKRVKQALSKRFSVFWFRASPGRNGRGSFWSFDGEPTGCRGYAESSLNSKVEADRKRERTKESIEA